MKNLLQNNQTKEYFLEENGVRKPLNFDEARTVIKESCGTICGTRSFFGEKDGFRKLEILSMEEWKVQQAL